MSKGLVLVWIGVLVFNLAVWWTVTSAITSGVKVFQNHCGKTYQIESVVNGNFFCE